jgi:hypothetical protein
MFNIALCTLINICLCCSRKSSLADSMWGMRSFSGSNDAAILRLLVVRLGEKKHSAPSSKSIRRFSTLIPLQYEVKREGSRIAQYLNVKQ